MIFFFCSNFIQNVQHWASASNVRSVGLAPNARKILPWDCGLVSILVTMCVMKSAKNAWSRRAKLKSANLRQVIIRWLFFILVLCLFAYRPCCCCFICSDFVSVVYWSNDICAEDIVAFWSSTPVIMHPCFFQLFVHHQPHTWRPHVCIHRINIGTETSLLQELLCTFSVCIESH